MPARRDSAPARHWLACLRESLLHAAVGAGFHARPHRPFDSTGKKRWLASNEPTIFAFLLPPYFCLLFQNTLAVSLQVIGAVWIAVQKRLGGINKSHHSLVFRVKDDRIETVSGADHHVSLVEQLPFRQPEGDIAQPADEMHPGEALSHQANRFRGRKPVLAIHTDGLDQRVNIDIIIADSL